VLSGVENDCPACGVAWLWMLSYSTTGCDPDWQRSQHQRIHLTCFFSQQNGRMQHCCGCSRCTAAGVKRNPMLPTCAAAHTLHSDGSEHGHSVKACVLVAAELSSPSLIDRFGLAALYLASRPSMLHPVAPPLQASSAPHGRPAGVAGLRRQRRRDARAGHSGRARRDRTHCREGAPQKCAPVRLRV
jgi:hypothetical protein